MTKYLLHNNNHLEQTYLSPYRALEARDALRKQERRYTEQSAWYVTDPTRRRIEFCDEPGCAKAATLDRLANEYLCPIHQMAGVGA